MPRRPGFREYVWTDEEPLAGREVRITAIITGSDTPARGPAYSHGGLPPEYREVEITVEVSFCPSTPDRCAGCEWEDITEDERGECYTSREQPLWDDFLDRMRDKACEREDEKYDIADEIVNEFFPSVMDTNDPEWGGD